MHCGTRAVYQRLTCYGDVNNRQPYKECGLIQTELGSSMIRLDCIDLVDRSPQKVSRISRSPTLPKHLTLN